MRYDEFIKSKEITLINSGIDINIDDLPNYLYDFQKDIVKWGLKKGKAALFADCGLGKTIMQLVWANEIQKRYGGKVLILAPLAVAEQTRREGVEFGIFSKVCENAEDLVDGINITNYEKLDKFADEKYIAVVLDESSILKSFDGKTRTKIINTFEGTPYRLACTATPAPNDFMEFGNHAEFLGIMSRNEMLSMYFTHDGGDTSKWRLKGHAEDLFWQFLGSWCVFINQPKDLGYDNSGYDLPECNVAEIVIDNGNQMEYSLSLMERRRARRDSIEERCAKAAELVNNSDEQWLVWCDLNDESKLLTEMINNAVEVKGQDKQSHKSQSMLDFGEEKIKCLVTKPSIAGFGMNWQNCHNMIFVGLSDSYEQYYQALRRCWRFGQGSEVNAYIVISSKEGCVLDNIKRKQADNEMMKSKMLEYTKEIVSKELKQTTRISTEYHPLELMILPRWEEFIS